MKTMDFMSAGSGKSEYDAFVLAYGQAIFDWQDVETELFKIYHALCIRLNENDIMDSSRKYYGKKTFQQKRKLVAAAAEQLVQIKSEIQWDELNANLKKKSKERNVLAHCPPCFCLRNGKLSVWKLCPPQFAPLQGIDFSYHHYDAEGLLRLSQDFKLLAQQIGEATKIVNCGNRVCAP